MENAKRYSKKIGNSIRFALGQLLLFSLTFTMVQAKNLNVQEILDQKISIELEEVSMPKLLKQIELKAGVYFTYKTDIINSSERISLKVENQKLSNVLDDVLKPMDLGYKVYGNSSIVINRLSNLDEATVDRVISGSVTDDSGEALIGANVVVKGTSIGTITDIDGSFSLSVPDNATTLVVSYAGYEDSEVDITNASSVLVTLSEGVALEAITVLGSRGKPRTDVDRPVPIDVVTTRELQATGQVDVGQSLQYSVPSFNAVKFGINDLAPLVDPASLRGLSPDQTLLLVNGKRRHKVSFFSLNDGIGKGQVGNDINAIPSAAVERFEVLRDGAAAQYGSDAIAGVLNLQLKKNSKGGSFRTYFGTAASDPKHDDQGANADLEGESIYESTRTDGETFSSELNFGIPWGEEGYVSTTLSFSRALASDRSGSFGSQFFTDEQLAEAGLSDDELLAQKGISRDRAILGTPENTNGGIFVNAGRSINNNWEFYAFGGVTRKEIVGGVFTRAPTREDRRVLEIFPNGFNPEVPSVLTDFQVSSGFRANFDNGWNMDFSAGQSSNDLQLFARNTVNPSLGAASPTQFFTGALNVGQTVFNADFNKSIGDKTTLAFGAESRFETFRQSQGQAESFVPGPRVLAGEDVDVGSTGREGFTAESDGEWNRNNVGVYAEIESDITESFLIGAAVRAENYSDFGGDFSFKVASRYKLSDEFGIRGSISRSFRAPALVQVHYSNFSQISFDNDGNSVLAPFLPNRDVRVADALGLGTLDRETSIDYAVGLTSQVGKFTFTLDGYLINLDDRILISTFDAADFPLFAASGFDEVSTFTNAINTTTRGLDFVGTYKQYFGDNRLNLSLAVNLTETELTEDGLALPEDLQGSVSQRDIDYLLTGTPRSKFILSGDYTVGKFTFLTRFTRFGEVFDPRATFTDDAGESQAQTFSAKVVTDVSITANVGEGLSITAGINNLLDVYPDLLVNPQTASEVIYSRRTNQFGTVGRFLNLAINYNW